MDSVQQIYATNLNIVFSEIDGLLGYLRLNFRLVVAHNFLHNN